MSINGQTEPLSSPDPFDLESLRINRSAAKAVGAEKILAVHVRRPQKHDFFRVHPDEKFRMDVAIVEIPGERSKEIYILTNGMVDELPNTYAMATAFVCINRQGDLSIWLVKIPADGSSGNEWLDSAREAASRAMKDWTRLSANMTAGCYDIYRAVGDLPEPVWPPHSFGEIMRVAFRDRIVDHPNHPLIRRLVGAE
jgi:hypothetical protein